MPSKRDASREMLVAALSGVLGGATAKVVTYPLDMTKTWLARKRHDETSLDVLKSLWQTGIYIGIRLRLSKNMFHNFLFFYVMEAITQLAKRLVNATRRLRKIPISHEFGMGVFFGAGFFGDALNIPFIAPVEFVLCQVMTSKTREGPMSVIRRTFRESGIGGFYVGWPVYLMASGRPAVRYGILESLRAYLLRGRDRNSVLSAMQAFWLGALSNAISSTLFYPLNTARIRITSRRREAEVQPVENGNEDSNSVLKTIAKILRLEGIRGLYHGLAPEIAEGMLGAAIQLVVKEKVIIGVRKVVYFGKA